MRTFFLSVQDLLLYLLINLTVFYISINNPINIVTFSDDVSAQNVVRSVCVLELHVLPVVLPLPVLRFLPRCIHGLSVSSDVLREPEQDKRCSDSFFRPAIVCRASNVDSADTSQTARRFENAQEGV